MLAANKIGGVQNSDKLIEKSRKLLKIRKLSKFQKLAKLRKKWSKNKNLPKFDN